MRKSIPDALPARAQCSLRVCFEDFVHETRFGAGGGEAVGIVGEVVLLGEGKAGGLDVESNDARGAACAGKGAGEEADRAAAKDADGLAGGKFGTAGGVEEDGERFGKGGSFIIEAVGDPGGGVRRGKRGFKKMKVN